MVTATGAFRWSATDLGRLGRAVLESAAEAVIYADRHGVIRFWNRGAERLFGWTADEALGQSLDIIIPEPQRARHWSGYERVMESGKSRYGEGDLLAVPGLRKNGNRVSLEFTIVPLQGEASRIEGMAAILRDVTKRFEEMRALRRQVCCSSPQKTRNGTTPSCPRMCWKSRTHPLVLSRRPNDGIGAEAHLSAETVSRDGRNHRYTVAFVMFSRHSLPPAWSPPHDRCSPSQAPHVGRSGPPAH